MRWWRLFCGFLAVCQAQEKEWDASNFPNPTAGQFLQCGATTRICDPDGILNESARQHLDHDLKQLEVHTRQENAQDFCSRKGVAVAIALAKRVKGGTAEVMANELLRNWTLDAGCHKAIVIVVAVDDRQFWAARDAHVPVYDYEFTQLFQQQKWLFKHMNYHQALKNIIYGIWERVLHKTQTPSSDDGQPVAGRGYNQNDDHNQIGDHGNSFRTPNIGIVSLLIIVMLVLLLACCLGSCFCCCCLAKISSKATSICTSFLASTIPVSMIVTGALNLGNCPLNDNIPRWLLVSGVFTLLLMAFNVLGSQKWSEPPLWLRLLKIMSMFTWFMLGTALVVRTYDDWIPTAPDSPEYCDQFTFLFSIVVLVKLAIAGLLGVCCWPCIGQAEKRRHQHKTPNKSRSQFPIYEDIMGNTGLLSEGRQESAE